MTRADVIATRFSGSVALSTSPVVPFVDRTCARADQRTADQKQHEACCRKTDGDNEQHQTCGQGGHAECEHARRS